MGKRARFGWLLLGAVCASVSCSGDKSSKAPNGFGLDCESDKDCKSYTLVCGASSKCVECLADSDCRPTEVCSAGLCKPPQKCEDSRDCNDDQVCATDYGICVDCNTSRDCPEGQSCSDNICGSQQTCEFTSDCNRGLVCETKRGVCVECRSDAECGLHQVCDANSCVDEPSSSSSSGDGGAAAGDSGGGTSGNSGSAAAGTSPAGGTTTGGSAAMAGSGGKGGSSGSAGVGGTNSAGTSQGGTSGTSGTAGTGGTSACGCTGDRVCTPDARCVSPLLIDDLVDCDSKILPIQGRKGNWAAAADTGINLMYGFSSPGTAWADRTCAAWATGGPVGTSTATSFAFIGFQLNSTASTMAAYSLAGYTGLEIKLESSASVQVVLKTVGGGYFYSLLLPVSGSNLRRVSFASMTVMANSLESVLYLENVYEIQFSPPEEDRPSFGMAIHSVALY